MHRIVLAFLLPAAAVRGHGTAVEFSDLGMDYMRGLPKARSLTTSRLMIPSTSRSTTSR